MKLSSFLRGPRIKPHTPKLTATALVVSLVVSIVVLVVIGMLAMGTARADGGDEHTDSQESGPYIVDINLSPGHSVLGQNQISVILRSLDDRELVTTATVEVSASGPEGSSGFQDIPAYDDQNYGLFQADIPFDLVGKWEVLVAISSDLGETMVVVPIDVAESGDGGINFIIVAAVVVIILAVIVFIWGKVSGTKEPSPEVG